MDIKLTKEQLNQLINDTALEICNNLNEEFISKIDSLSDEQKENPLYREIIAITVAQNNAILVIKEVLMKLFFEE